MSISKSTFTTPRGEIEIYRITNNCGASVVLSSLGAGIIEVNVPDSHGKIENVALNYRSLEDYFYDGPCMGKTPGRYANRIARGKFSIDGREYTLAINNGSNALHGGPEGFQNRLWNSQTAGSDTVIFSRRSADGEEGYPGNLDITVKYRWTDDNRLIISYKAVTDAPTVVNLTNHCYWNLGGATSGCALDHLLMLNASRYLVTDKDLTPTGELAPVASTPMDFSDWKVIGKDINKDFPALVFGKGYDNCWVVNRPADDDTLILAAGLACEKTGRQLMVSTTLPGVQVYSGNWLKGSPIAPDGHEYADYDGIAIECQHFPDAPNHASFPSALLRPGETYDHMIEFYFTTHELV